MKVTIHGEAMNIVRYILIVYAISAAVNAGMIGRWLSGETNLADTSGFTTVGTHDGVAVGSNAALLAWSTDVPSGFSGKSLDLSANYVAVMITNTALTDGSYTTTFDQGITSMFTVAFWYRGLIPTGYGAWVTKSGLTPWGWQTRQYTEWVDFTMRSNTGETEPKVWGGSLYTANIWTNDTWYHYAAVFNGTGSYRKIYINGAVVEQTTGSAYNVTFANMSHLLLGANQVNATNGTIANFWPGKMYDVRIYNNPMSTEDIKLLLLRRPVVINPTPSLSGLALWLDASRLTGLTNGQQVATWTDMSGAGNHATRDVSSSNGFPQYTTAALNGLPVVRFSTDGSSYYNFTQIATIRSVFWVLKEATPARHHMLGSGTASDFHRASEYEANYPSIWSSMLTSQNITNGVTKLMGAVVDGTVTPPGSGYRLVSLVTIGNVVADRISYDRASGGTSWDGDIAEILIYTNALNADNEQQVGSYLSAKYGLDTAYPRPRAIRIGTRYLISQ